MNDINKDEIVTDSETISNYIEEDTGSKNVRKFDLERKSFIVFKDAILKTDFKSDKKENDIDSLYHVTGSFDLDMNGKTDKISITLGRRVNNQDSIIQINDKRLEYVFDNPGDVYVCDLDKRDKFEEIAIYDDGPSGEPQIVFFRYDSDEIQKLGVIICRDGCHTA